MIEYFSNWAIILSFGVYFPFIISILRFKSISLNISAKKIMIYIFIDVLAWFASIGLSISGIKNIIVTNVFSVCEFFLITAFFIDVFKTKSHCRPKVLKKSKKMLYKPVITTTV